MTHNPDRTSLVISFSQEALKNAGIKLASIRQSTSQSTDKDELSETAKHIIELLRQPPKITYDEIASSLGKARSGIARHLKSMQKAGIILPKNEDGKWTVLIDK